jgi:Na+/proline symporter
LICAIGIAWGTRDMNIALLVWMGVGGMMAATAAPMFLGIFWRRSTRAGALVGFIVGGLVFSLLKSASIKASWFSGGSLAEAGTWLEAQAINPFACATLGSGAAIVAMIVVSLFTKQLDDAHLKRVFGN